MEAYLRSFGGLTEAEIARFSQSLTSKTLSKGDFLITEGTICREAAFVVSGAVRSFYYSSENEEVTYCFTFANNFLTAYSSFISQTPTQENIQALVDTELLTISKETVMQLEASSPNWLKVFKQLAEQEYIKMERRIFLLQKESAEKRYQDLLAHSPEYLQRIPLHQLASYLGITQRHLSRIRKELTN